MVLVAHDAAHPGTERGVARECELLGEIALSRAGIIAALDVHATKGDATAEPEFVDGGAEALEVACIDEQRTGEATVHRLDGQTPGLVDDLHELADKGQALRRDT